MNIYIYEYIYKGKNVKDIVCFKSAQYLKIIRYTRVEFSVMSALHVVGCSKKRKRKEKTGFF